MNVRAIVLGIGLVTLVISLSVLVAGFVIWNEPLIGALGGLSCISSAAVVWLGLRIH